MALADSYARRAQPPTPAPASGITPSGAAPDKGAFSDATLPARPRSNNTATQYQRAQIETASPTRLVIMLHEGAIRFCQIALDAMAQKDLHTQHVNLLKAQRIVSQLLGTLNRDRGGDIAENLFRVYPHMLELLVEANLRDLPQPVQTVQAMLRDLRDSWLEVERVINGGDASPPQGAASPRQASPPAKITNTPRLGDRNA